MTPESSVAGALTSAPHARIAFDILGVDYCCAPERSLRDAAAAAAIDVDELIAIASGHEAPPLPPHATTRTDAPLNEITSLLSRSIHRRARTALVRLIADARRLGSAHAARFPELWRVRIALEHIAHDLVPHMSKEERYLFPYIDSMAAGKIDATSIVPLFGTVEYPLQGIRHDHAEDLRAVAELRELTRGFEVPEGACDHMRQFYRALSEFVSELQRHIHLENDVLFPRAVELEKQRAQR